jgi:hypothetical protein
MRFWYRGFGQQLQEPGNVRAEVRTAMHTAMLMYIYMYMCVCMCGVWIPQVDSRVARRWSTAQEVGTVRLRTRRVRGDFVWTDFNAGGPVFLILTLLCLCPGHPSVKSFLHPPSEAMLDRCRWDRN